MIEQFKNITSTPIGNVAISAISALIEKSSILLVYAPIQMSVITTVTTIKLIPSDKRPVISTAVVLEDP